MERTILGANATRALIALLVGLCAGAGLVGLTAQASATIITLTYTGIVTSGIDNNGDLTGAGVNSSFSGLPFRLNYVFDTSLAAAGDYTNSGSSSSLSGESPSDAGGAGITPGTSVGSVSLFVVGSINLIPQLAHFHVTRLRAMRRMWDLLTNLYITPLIITALVG
jgi:hypothetical protein